MTPLESARPAYWAALESGDRRAALTLVERLHAAGVPSRAVVEELVTRSQTRVGDLWAAGAWAIGHEHRATAINESVVHWLAARTPAAAASGRPVLVACIDREEHVLPALVVAEGLLAAGCAVHRLPGSTRPDTLVATALRLEPRAVLLSASLTSSLAPHRPVLSRLRAAGVPVLVGGSAWGGPARALRLGATAYAEGVDEALAALDTLPERLPQQPAPPATASEREADALLAQRLLVTAGASSLLLRRLVGTADRFPSWWTDLDSQLDHVVGCLAASLATEDPSIVEEVRGWMTSLMAARRGAPDVVDVVWEVLGDVLAEHPGARRLLDATGGERRTTVPAAG
jgi:MerR family transcriptional regulator, light-induced transcriptional regulator